MSTDVVESQPAAWFGLRDAPPYAALTLVGVVVVWQLATYLLDIPSYLLPSPAAIANDLVRRWHILLANSWITVFEILVGFLISVLIGIPLAVCVTYSRALDRAIYPLIVGSQTIPKVAIAPLLLTWFGFGLFHWCEQPLHSAVPEVRYGDLGHISAGLAQCGGRFPWLAARAGPGR